jgi:radical SAM protein with 4Fe4S-binding SPASM domain
MVGRRLAECIGAECFDLFPSDEKPSERDMVRWETFLRRYKDADEMKELDFPPQLDVELNRMCNFSCSFCEHGHSKIADARLGFDRYARVVDEAAENGLVSLKLNYINEPLLVRDLERYIEYAKSRGVLNVYFATNGSLLTRKRSIALIESGLSKIMVSLDAASPDMFKKMRGSDQLERIEENIRAFIEERNRRGRRFPLVRVNFLKTEVNQHEALDFMLKWEGVADMVWFQEQHAVPGVEQAMLAITDRDGFKCKTPFKLMAVDSLGQILPCCTFQGRSLAAGSIDGMSLKEAWSGEKFTSLRKMHHAGEYKKNPLCDECVNGCG